MADSIYVKVGDDVEQLDLGGGSAPEYVERIEALEAYAEEQAQKDEEQDAKIAEAQSSADAAQSSISQEKQLLEAQIQKAVPAGTVIAFAANSAPEGYLLCNGAAVSRTTYADLFAVIGTTYGEGDGSTTFSLPNLTDKFIQGSGTAGTVHSAGLPNIWGQIRVANAAFRMQVEGAEGAFGCRGWEQIARSYGGSGTSANTDIYFNAALSSEVYGRSETVQPPALTMRYYIKY